MQSGLNGDSSSSQTCDAELPSSPEHGEVPSAAWGSVSVVCLWLCSVPESSLDWTFVMCLFLWDTHLHPFFCHNYFPIYVQFALSQPTRCVSRLCAAISSVIPFEFHSRRDHFLFLRCISNVRGQPVRLWRTSHGSISARQEGGTAQAALLLRGPLVDAQWPVPDGFDRGDVIGHRSWWASVTCIVNCGPKQWHLCFMQIVALPWKRKCEPWWETGVISLNWSSWNVCIRNCAKWWLYSKAWFIHKSRLILNNSM